MAKNNRNNGGNGVANFTGRTSNGGTIPDPAELARQRDEAAVKEKEAAEAAQAEADKQAEANRVDEGALGQPAADQPATKLQVEVADVKEGDLVSVQRVAVAETPEPEPVEPPPLAQAEVKELLPPAQLEPVKAEPATTPPPFQARIAANAAVVKAQRAESPAAVQTAFAPSTEFEALVQSIRTNGTPTAVRLVIFLDNYVKDMAPRRPRTADEIRKAQEGLYSKLVEVVEHAPVLEFERLFRIIIMYAREYRTQCFSPKYAMRGAPEWSRSPEQFHLFTRLMNVVLACATDRARDVTIPATPDSGLSLEALGRMRNLLDTLRISEINRFGR